MEIAKLAFRYFSGNNVGVARKIAQSLPDSNDFVVQENMNPDCLKPSDKIKNILHRWGFRDCEVIGCGSIAIVYRAARKSDGRQFCFKCIRPSAKKTIHDDVLALTQTASVFKHFNQSTQEAIKNASDTLQKEIDLLNESEMCKLLSRALEGVDGCSCPNVDTDLSCPDILVYDYQEGIPLSMPSIVFPQETSVKLVDFFYTAFLMHGILQTDMNPGNFLWDSGHLVALDMGSVIQIPEEEMRFFWDMHECKGDDAKIFQACNNEGLAIAISKVQRILWAQESLLMKFPPDFFEFDSSLMQAHTPRLGLLVTKAFLQLISTLQGLGHEVCFGKQMKKFIRPEKFSVSPSSRDGDEAQ